MTRTSAQIVFRAEKPPRTHRGARAKRGGQRAREQVLQRERGVAHAMRRHTSRADHGTVSALVRRVVRADQWIERQRHPRRDSVARRRPSDRMRRADVDLAAGVVEGASREEQTENRLVVAMVRARRAGRIDARLDRREAPPFGDQLADVGARAVEAENPRGAASLRGVFARGVHEPPRAVVTPARDRRLTGERQDARARDAIEDRIERAADDRRAIQPQHEPTAAPHRLVDRDWLPCADFEPPHVRRMRIEHERLDAAPTEAATQMAAIARGQSQIDDDHARQLVVAVTLDAQQKLTQGPVIAVIGGGDDRARPRGARHGALFYSRHAERKPAPRRGDSPPRPASLARRSHCGLRIADCGFISD